MNKKFDVDDFVDSYDAITDNILGTVEKTTYRAPCPYCQSEDYEKLVYEVVKGKKRSIRRIAGCTDCDYSDEE